LSFRFFASIALATLVAATPAAARKTISDDAVVVPVTLTGRIVSVADGDTVTLLDSHKRQHRIRLAGIDAPERSQAFGTRSRQALGALAHNRQARAQCDKKDRYGRFVCTVWVDATNVNLSQLHAGMAWHYRAYAKEQPRDERLAYESAEAQAQAARIGLWQDSAPTPPWDFRKSEKVR